MNPPPGDEQIVIDLVTSRVRGGAQKYGRLDVVGSPRDFLLEALEEAIDGAVYLACELVRIRRLRDDA